MKANFWQKVSSITPPPPPPLPGGDRRAGMNSTLGVIISTTIRLSSQYLITVIGAVVLVGNRWVLLLSSGKLPPSVGSYPRTKTKKYIINVHNLIFFFFFCLLHNLTLWHTSVLTSLNAFSDITHPHCQIRQNLGGENKAIN